MTDAKGGYLSTIAAKLVADEAAATAARDRSLAAADRQI
jgi:hypothetical protein